MPTTIFQVDAFTDAPFSGNPAGVCILPEPADEAWMQAVASEMNLAETAFLVPGEDGFALRWFTPAVEVDLCGHATLASAHVLWEQGHLPGGTGARFHTASGLLTCVRRPGGWIEMDFPAEPEAPWDPPPGLLEALGVPARYVGRNRLDTLVEVESEYVVRGVQPDFKLLAKVPVRGTIVTAPSADPRFDFVSRFFAPAAGIDEDPATGSSHCCLGPYWGEHLRKHTLLGRQLSRRGGTIGVELAGERVKLLGQAVTVMRVELLTG